MTLSLSASVLAHALLLFGAAMMLRALPAATKGARSQTTLIATIVTTPAPSPEKELVTTPVLATDAIVDASIAVPVPPRPSRALPGIASSPSMRVLDAEFAPVGRTMVGGGTGRKYFGDDIATQMAERYPKRADRLPKMTGALGVLYPVAGARKGQSIVMEVLLMLDEYGHILEARVLPDDPQFAAAVLKSLADTTFIPAMADGKAIPYWTVLEFHFDIDGPTGPDGRRLDR